MNIKNYSTTIQAEKSIMEIEKILSQFGATHIMKEYSDCLVIGMAFRFQEQGYKVPANIEGVANKIYKRYNATKSQLKQSYNATWRLIKDWIYSQLSIIICGQAEAKEVFLPYMWDGKRTLYNAYKDGKIQLEHKETNT